MKRYFTSLILLLWLHSCVISTAVTRKDENFTGKVSKIYIIMRGSDSSVEFFNGFREELKIQFATKGVEMESELIDPLALETDVQMINRVSKFAPQYIMLVNQTESRITQNYGNVPAANTGASFDVQLRSLDGAQIFYRANLHTDTTLKLKKAAKNAAKRLFWEMDEDEMF